MELLYSSPPPLSALCSSPAPRPGWLWQFSHWPLLCLHLSLFPQSSLRSQLKPSEPCDGSSALRVKPRGLPHPPQGWSLLILPILLTPCYLKCRPPLKRLPTITSLLLALLAAEVCLSFLLFPSLLPFSFSNFQSRHVSLPMEPALSLPPPS